MTEGDPNAEADTRSPSEAAHEEIDALIASVRSAAETEIAYWKARASYTAREARLIAFYYGMALAVGTGAILAFIFGLLLVLNPLIGPIWSTLSVCGAFSLLAAALGYVASRKLRQLNFRRHHEP